MSALFYLPFLPVPTQRGLPAGAAKAYFYESGTTTLKTVYADAALTTPLANPVVADAMGRLPNIYMPDNAVYRVSVVDRLGAAIGLDIDPYYPGQAVTIVPDLPAFAAPDGSSRVGFRQAGVAARNRTMQDKGREVEVSIADYGAAPNALAAANAALAVLGTATPARLVFPTGAWTIDSAVDWSPYRLVTFEFRPGALINQGSNTVILPERVEMGLGAKFTGTGAVSQKNKDQTPLAVPGAGHVLAGNVARGVGALGAIAGGYSNFAEGVNALAKAQYVRSSIAWGNGALQSVVGDPTGARAYGTYYAFGDSNIAIGDITLRDTTTGYENLAVGVGTLVKNTTGRWNVAIGHQSQITGTVGENNVSVGCYNLTTSQTSNNTAMGWAAMEVNTTGSGTAYGYVAMNAQTTGNGNVGIGQQALQLNTTGNFNTAIGQEPLKNMVGGNNNVAVGAFALGQATGGIGNNTAIGRDSLLTNMTGNENTGIGSGALNGLVSYNNCAGLGFAAAVTGNNQVQLGDSRTVTYTFGAVQNRSDARDKTDVRDTVLGLDFITALRPVDFRWDMRDFYREVGEPLSDASPNGSKKRVRYHHGLIAQEVRAVMQAQGIDFGGFQNHAMQGGDDVLSLGYDELIGPLIKAVQQLSARVVALEAAQ